MLENFRREPIRSRAYLDGSKDQTCVFAIPGVCVVGPTVACHLHDETFGMANKADDTSTGDGCMACHDAMDGRSMVLTREDWLFYAFRALQRTIRRRIEQQILRLKLDAPAKPKAPKPKPDRAPSRPIQSRGFDTSVSRPIPQPVDPWGKSRKAKAKIGATP
jgi:hypothetical protein